MIRTWVMNEVKRALPPVIFFTLTFNIVHLAESLTLRPGDHPYTSVFGATVGGLIAGKVILLANALPLINAFPHRPLIYNISWKFLIYGLVALLVQMLDMFAKGLIHHLSITEAFAHVCHHISLPFFWGIQVQIFLLLLFYVTGSELTRVMSAAKMRQLMLG